MKEHTPKHLPGGQILIVLCGGLQAVEWLSELLDALLKTHVRLGDDGQETRGMLDKHRKFVDVAQVRLFLITQPKHPSLGASSIEKVDQK